MVFLGPLELAEQCDRTGTCGTSSCLFLVIVCVCACGVFAVSSFLLGQHAVGGVPS